MNKVLGAIIIILIGAGAWYFWGGGKAVIEKNAPSDSSESMGTYEYMCDNGATFSMSPSADVRSITLSAGSQGMFTGEKMLQSVESSAGARFEGEGVVFVGAGEGVQLTVGNQTAVCNPVPSTGSPPWNWGDAGEGGSVKQDASLIVSESIVGKWQSVDDAKFIREFKAGGAVEDWYDNEVVTSGLWVAFTKENAPLRSITFPLEENTVYLQLTMQGTQADNLNFKLTKLTPDELELIYMDRGGALRFKAVQ